MPRPLCAPLEGLISQGEEVAGLQVRDPFGQSYCHSHAFCPPARCIDDEHIRHLVASLRGAEGRQYAKGGRKGGHAEIRVVLGHGRAGVGYEL